MANRSPSRRNFLIGAARFAAGAALAGCSSWSRFSWRKADPFQLGVAAGSPTESGFVLWTKLAPDPMSSEATRLGAQPVAYEIASDPAMRSIVRSGIATADPDFDLSVHAEIVGLAPGQSYWYRFMHGDATSRVGRAMTLPAAGTPIDKLRLGFVSCSNYEQGYFSAYRHLTDEAPDLVLFLGDYIYEYIDQRPGKVRLHSDGVEAASLPTYRHRYAQYKLDPDLQRLHAEVPALITWDDHEVQNDYADKWSMTFEDPQTFLLRRAAAYQAFYENMPVKPSLSLPRGPDMRVYDRFTLGGLIEVSMIDGRQYRSREACYAPPDHGRGHVETDRHCPELTNAKRSMLGLAQEQWLFDGLAKSTARWNIIAQDVLMAQFREASATGSADGFWTDDWNGYPASRARLLKHIHDSKVSNPVVLSGDNHAFWMNDLKLDFDDAKSAIVATEFLGTSITSYPGPRDVFLRALPNNPHVKFFDCDVRGYATLDVTPDSMTARYQAVSNAKDPNATVATLRTFRIDNGKTGAYQV